MKMIIVKLRERVWGGFGKGRSPKGHLQIVDYQYPFPRAYIKFGCVTFPPPPPGSLITCGLSCVTVGHQRSEVIIGSILFIIFIFTVFICYIIYERTKIAKNIFFLYITYVSSLCDLSDYSVLQLDSHTGYKHTWHLHGQIEYEFLDYSVLQLGSHTGYKRT